MTEEEKKKKEQAEALEQLNGILDQSRPKNFGQGLTSGVSNILGGALGAVGVVIVAPVLGGAMGMRGGGIVGGLVGVAGGVVVGAVGAVAMAVGGTTCCVVLYSYDSSYTSLWSSETLHVYSFPLFFSCLDSLAP
jgi:hypothetical protein